jgi:enoyl-[acyl-carrier protein] reductase I
VRQHYVITGVANEWSIAWAVAKRIAQSGGTCHFMSLPQNLRRVRRLMAELEGDHAAYPLDVTSDASIDEAFAALRGRTDRLSGMLHSIAYADLEDLAAGALGLSREGFLRAVDISVYSLIALARRAEALMAEGGSVVALTYYGAQKCFPGYDVMGVAKAALESLVRYLALGFGPRGIRVNAVSAGPILTLASSAFSDVEAKIERAAQLAPLGRATAATDVADTAAYLFSTQAAGITGQCLFVDNGLSIMGAA